MSRGTVVVIAIVALASAFIGAQLARFYSLPESLPEPLPAPAPFQQSQPPRSIEVPVGTSNGSPVVAVAERVAPAVVGVTSEEVLVEFFTGRRFTESVGSGSGVFFDSRGYIVTNYHVIRGADRVVVALPGGERLPAEVVGTDSPTDLAVLKVDPPKEAIVAEFADSDRIRVGETAIAIGNPLGMEFQSSVTVGVVSGIRSLPYGQGEVQRVSQLVQTDAAINPGNSGGALLNAAGQVIGINTFKFSEAQNVSGMGFAIPANTVKRVAEDIVKYGRVRRALLGVNFMSREEARWALNRRIERGLPVFAVAEDGPAARAGLRPGDVIVSLGGNTMDEYLDAITILEKKRPGDTLAIVFLRNGEERTIEVTLDEMR